MTLEEALTIEGMLKVWNGKKWKSRYCVVKKSSPIARFMFVKESEILAVLYDTSVLLLAFDDSDKLTQWALWFRNCFGYGDNFRVQAFEAPLAANLLVDQYVRIHLQDGKFCMSTKTPPIIVMTFPLTVVRSYGALQNHFYFVLGSKAGELSGTYNLLTGESDKIEKSWRYASEKLLHRYLYAKANRLVFFELSPTFDRNSTIRRNQQPAAVEVTHRDLASGPSTSTLRVCLVERKSSVNPKDYCDDILVDASKFTLPRRPQLPSTSGSVVSTRSESSSSSTFRNNNDGNNLTVIPAASSSFTDRHVYRNEFSSIQRPQNHRRPPASAPPASAETALIGTFFNFSSMERSYSPPSSPPSPFTSGGGTATDFQINYCRIAPNIGAITESSSLRNGNLPPLSSSFRRNCDHPRSSRATSHFPPTKSNSACVSRRNSNEDDDDEEQQYYQNHNFTTFQTTATPSSFQHLPQTRDQKILKTQDVARFEYAKIDEVATKAISKNFMVRSRFEQPLISSQTLPRNACGRDTLPSTKVAQKGGKLLRKGANLLRRRTSLTSLLNH